MPSTRLRDLKDEYQKLWDSCEIKPEFLKSVKEVTEKILATRDRYEAVQQQIGVPWYFVAVIHNMECSLNFKGHLHNGDSLQKRTVKVPPGRPINPPKLGWNVGYSWEESAIDALKFKEFDQAKDWSLAAQLWRLESYNGFGYRLYHPEVLTPYLWSTTNHYKKGKYTADGKWDGRAVSAQIGAAALLKLLISENQEIDATKADKTLEENKSEEKGDKSTLLIVNEPGAFLKLKPEQVVALSDEEKVWLKVGKELPVLVWLKENDHFFIKLDGVTFKERESWYVFCNHCQLKPRE